MRRATRRSILLVSLALSIFPFRDAAPEPQLASAGFTWPHREVPALPSPVTDAPTPDDSRAPAAPGPAATELDLSKPDAIAAHPPRVAATPRTDPGDLPRLVGMADDRTLALPLRHTAFAAETSGSVAHVTVTQSFHNPLQVPAHATYVFRLPANSAVKDFEARLGERVIRSEIRPRDEARREYEETRAAGRTADLREQEHPNTFTLPVVSIAPGAALEVRVEYVQDLSYDEGGYELALPLVALPPSGGGLRSGRDVSVQVIVDRSLPIRDLEVSTHDVEIAQRVGHFVVQLAAHDRIPDRDFVLRYKVARDVPQGALTAHKGSHGGFFTLALLPPGGAVDTPVARRELIFIVDTFGSMAGAPMGICKDAMRLVLRNLRPVDTFNVLTFGGRTARLFDGPRPANDAGLRAAFEMIDALRPGIQVEDPFGTALGGSLVPGHDRFVVLFTDGYLDGGEQIVTRVQSFVSTHRRAGRRARVFVMGTGVGADRSVLDRIAKVGDGAAFYTAIAGDVAPAVRKLARIIDKPVMTDVTLDWGDLAVTQLMTDSPRDLLPSRPLLFYGRYGAGGTGVVTLRGQAGGREMTLHIPVTLPDDEPRNSALAALWARKRSEQLERELWREAYLMTEGSSLRSLLLRHDWTAPVDTITWLGRDYRTVTAFTSLLAVDWPDGPGSGRPLSALHLIEQPERLDARTLQFLKSQHASASRIARRRLLRPDHYAAPDPPRAAHPPYAPPRLNIVGVSVLRGAIDAVEPTRRIHRSLDGVCENEVGAHTKGTLTAFAHVGAGGRVLSVQLDGAGPYSLKACVWSALVGQDVGAAAAARLRVVLRLGLPPED